MANNLDGTTIQFFGSTKKALGKAIGRPDLGISSWTVEGNFVWELKPNNSNAIALGEVQVQGYVVGQQDLRDRPGRTYVITNPYRAADVGPWEYGLKLQPNTIIEGGLGTYAFDFAGKGVMTYSYSEYYRADPFRVPVPLPLPGRQRDEIWIPLYL